jgi:hypothetical protein
MLTLQGIKARPPRLQERIQWLSEEVQRWKHDESPLLALERRAYLEGIQDALAGLDEAVVVLEKAVERIEALKLPW